MVYTGASLFFLLVITGTFAQLNYQGLNDSPRDRRSPQFGYGGGHRGNHLGNHFTTHKESYGFGPFHASFTSIRGHSNPHAYGQHGVGPYYRPHRPHYGGGYHNNHYGYNRPYYSGVGHGSAYRPGYGGFNGGHNHGYRPQQHYGGGLFSFLDF